MNKKLIIFIVCSLFSFQLSSGSLPERIETKQEQTKKEEIIEVKRKSIDDLIATIYRGNDYNINDYIDSSNYFKILRFKESSNVHDTVNRFGYMGWYQFGKSTLKTIGINCSKKEFLNDTILQNQAMTKLIKWNIKRMYHNKVLSHIDNKNLTLEGALAMSHLLGHADAKRVILYEESICDANGTTGEKYNNLFNKS